MTCENPDDVGSAVLIATELHHIAHAIELLGNAGGVSPEGGREWGGLEALGMSIKDAAGTIAGALAELEEAVRR